MHKINHIIWLICVPLSAACQQPDGNSQPEGFEVVAHDVSNGRYTILERSHEDEGRYVVSKIVAQCKSFQWGSHPVVGGLDPCALVVGRIYRTNVLDQSRAKGVPDVIVTLLPGGSAIDIAEGVGNDRTSNYLDILSQTVISDVHRVAN